MGEQTVTQVFGSAISVSYSGATADAWEPMGRLVLRASYMATLHVAAEAAVRRGGKAGSQKVFLTLLGGGVFGNPLEWIIDAIREACDAFRDSDLEVIIVSYGGVPPAIAQLCEEFEGTANHHAAAASAAPPSTSASASASAVSTPAAPTSKKEGDPAELR